MATNSTEEPEKDIVSFNQALELCSIGYDEPTFCMYEIENRQLCLCHLDEEGLYMPDKDLHAPTKGQVFRWFREKYELSGFCRQVDKKGRTYWKIVKIETEDKIKGYSAFTDTYEEAENACIDNLIELAKQK